MTARPSASSAAQATTVSAGNSLLTLLAGVPLAAAILWGLHQPLFDGTLAQRYVSHPIEKIEVLVFSCALTMLLGKLWNVRRQRRALRHEWLPAWDGQACRPEEAQRLLQGIESMPRALRATWVGRRVAGTLDFVARRRSAEQLDDHLRSQSDLDGLALEGSYRLVGYFNWLVPILGFLGTVLGISEAVAGVDPDQLESEISKVTGGLALAFDTTSLALILSPVSMLLAHIAERRESSVLEEIDQLIDDQLAHRFERQDGAHGPVLAAVQDSAQALLQSTEALVERQASLWSATMSGSESRWHQAVQVGQEQLTAALSAAIQRSLLQHEAQLTALRHSSEQQVVALMTPLGAIAESLAQQQHALAGLTHQIAALTEALAHLQTQEAHLLRQQGLLEQNLATLAGAGAFEHAVHSLTAAVHLLTARASGAGWRADVTPVAGVVHSSGREAA